jgi:hypothetical protein
MKRIFTLCFAFFLVMTSSYCPACFGTGVTIYFYNPETNIDNFATLKTEFDSYLSTQGSYQFQPFDNKESFEASLNKKGIYLLSSWHFDALQQQKIPLQIVLIGTFNGNKMQKKVLSAKKDIGDFSMLKNTTIAGAGTETYIRSVLQQVDATQYKELADSIKILTVPKDIDALMAVGFGMANAAVCAESSLKKLETINPNQYKQLHTLGSSKENYLLVAATLENPGKDLSKLVDILDNMSRKETGKKNLNLLGLDGLLRK